VYRLDDEGKWVDEGTGMVECKYMDRLNSYILLVVSDGESQGKVILESTVAQEDVYEMQGKMIITWNDPENNTELALSFEDTRGCEDIWDQLCSIQGRMNSDFSAGNRGRKDSLQDVYDTRKREDDGYLDLPEPKKENLETILDMLSNSSPVVREGLRSRMLSQTQAYNNKTSLESTEALESSSSSDLKGYAIVRPEKVTCSTYLGALLNLFRELEKENDLKKLHTLHAIIKMLVLFNDPNVIDMILSDDYFYDIVGALEYDPDIVPKPNHRQYLSKRVEHKMVIPIRDPMTLKKIHQSFRIRFFRDVLLPRSLEESTISMLGDMDAINGIEIATALHEDDHYLKDVFAILHSNDDPKKRAEALACLQELCSLAKKMQVPSRNAFYRSLLLQGNVFFGIFEAILGDENSTVRERLNIGDILKLALQHDPAMLRSFILKGTQNPGPPALTFPDGSQSKLSMGVIKQRFAAPAGYYEAPSSENDTEDEDKKKPPPKLSLMSQLLKRVVYDPEAGMQAQACEILRMLLDPETMEVSEKETFLCMFYEGYIQWLVFPLELVRVDPDVRDQKEPYQLVLSGGLMRGPQFVATNNSKEAEDTARVAEHHITELLSFCVQTHGYRIKYYVLRNNIVSKVLRLLYSKHKHLVLGAIRFARICVGLKDDFYNRHFIKHDLLKPVFEIFKTNGPRNNLINSAIMELLEFIGMENIRMLVKYVVEHFGELLKQIDYVDTYSRLLQKHKENETEGNHKKDPDTISGLRAFAGNADNEEEGFVKRNPLVPYKDEEEEEEKMANKSKRKANTLRLMVNTSLTGQEDTLFVSSSSNEDDPDVKRKRTGS